MKTSNIPLVASQAVGFSVSLTPAPVPRARTKLCQPAKTVSPSTSKSRPAPSFHYLHVGPCAWRGESLVAARQMVSVYNLTMPSGHHLKMKTFKTH